MVWVGVFFYCLIEGVYDLVHIIIFDIGPSFVFLFLKFSKIALLQLSDHGVEVHTLKRLLSEVFWE